MDFRKNQKAIRFCQFNTKNINIVQNSTGL